MIKKILSLLGLGLLLTLSGNAQRVNISNGARIDSKTVATLPASGNWAGRLFWVTDADDTGDCTSGGGSDDALCIWDGSAWQAFGTTAGVGAVDSVNGEVGVVVIDADDIDDAATTKKFTNAAGLAVIAATSGTNTGDQTTISGNAGTATALAANPTDCAANQFAYQVDASGNLTCSALADADIPNNITITLAATATALAANGTNCTGGEYAVGVDASGNAEGCAAVPSADALGGGDPGANGIMSRTALNSTVARTITGNSQVSVADGDGVSGPPTLGIVADSIGPTQQDETANYVFSGTIFPTGTAPTTSAVGQLAMDTNAWAASRGALQYFDGTASVFAVSALASDTPTNGQVPKWNTGGTITWEDDTGGGSFDEAGNYTPTGTWDFSGAAGVTLPSGTGFGSGTTPFNLTSYTDDVAPSAPGTANQFTAYLDRSSGFWSWIINGGSAQTAVTTAGTQTLTNKTLTSPVIGTISNTGTLTLPTSTDTLVGRATTDTLTNKTLTAPVISTISNTGTLTLPTSTDTLVGRATTDTLTNKTLTTPVIASISNSGTITVPTGTDTLVARATTDTLTNKTLTSPVINDGTVNIDGGTFEAPNSNTLPGTCAVGEVYFDADATAGSNLYGCTATNTWTLQGGGSTAKCDFPYEKTITGKNNTTYSYGGNWGTNGRGYLGNGGWGYSVYSGFDDVADATTYQLVVPRCYASGTYDLVMHFIRYSVGTLDQQFTVKTAFIADDEALQAPTFNAGQTFNVAQADVSANGDLNVVTLTGLTMTGAAAEEMMLLDFELTTDNGGSGALIGFTIREQ